MFLLFKPIAGRLLILAAGAFSFLGRSCDALPLTSALFPINLSPKPSHFHPSLAE
jgi:hypothetical protein